MTEPIDEIKYRNAGFPTYLQAVNKRDEIIAKHPGFVVESLSITRCMVRSRRTGVISPGWLLDFTARRRSALH